MTNKENFVFSFAAKFEIAVASVVICFRFRLCMLSIGGLAVLDRLVCS